MLLAAPPAGAAPPANDLPYEAATLTGAEVVLRGRLRVDFVFLFAALIVEYLGGVHDGRADYDATRNYVLERLGYRSITVTKSMAREGPGLIAHIHTIRRERGAAGARRAAGAPAAAAPAAPAGPAADHGPARLVRP